jgi:hypothetical protein
MHRKAGQSAREGSARNCVLRAAIGRMLAAQYDLAQPLPERLENLLARIENADEISAVEIPHRPTCREIDGRASPTWARATSGPSGRGNK